MTHNGQKFNHNNKEYTIVESDVCPNKNAFWKWNGVAKDQHGNYVDIVMNEKRGRVVYHRHALKPTETQFTIL